MATIIPSGLTGVTRGPVENSDHAPHPIMTPPMPMANVVRAPPGSRPGIMALANSPTSVPNPIHTSTSFTHWAACGGNSEKLPTCAIAVSTSMGSKAGDVMLMMPSKSHGQPLRSPFQLTRVTTQNLSSAAQSLDLSVNWLRRAWETRPTKTRHISCRCLDEPLVDWSASENGHFCGSFCRDSDQMLE